MSSNSQIGLRQWIWRAFAQSALIPLLLVETVLIAVYLLSNSSIRETQIDYLRDSAVAELKSAAALEGRVVEEQLAKVGGMTELYRNLTAQALQQPAPSPVRNLALSADGVRYSPRDEGGAAVFYPNSTAPAKHDLDKVARLARLDPLMQQIKTHTPLVAALYFNSWDSLNHIYPWFLTPDQYPHDMVIPDYNFYYLADAKHNPQRQVVWTDVYLDPAGQGWMASAIARSIAVISSKAWWASTSPWTASSRRSASCRCRGTATPCWSARTSTSWPCPRRAKMILVSTS